MVIIPCSNQKRAVVMQKGVTGSIADQLYNSSALKKRNRLLQPVATSGRVKKIPGGHAKLRIVCTPEKKNRGLGRFWGF